ncbi:MAG: class F sortase [Actinomycetia bacterium]|nr:class F sortase [Actinomycetes bacterium]
MSNTTGGHRADREPRRRRGRGALWLVTLVCVVALAGGGVLFWRGVEDSKSGPHAQPLPTSLFTVAPAEARAMQVPAALKTPQSGSIQTSCDQYPGAQPQVAIPSLCIYAPMVATQVVDGSLVIPQDVHQVGLDLGSAPLDSDTGTTIIAGHVDSAVQGDGVFFFLHQVEPGAEIIVVGLDNQTTKWRVNRNQIVEKSQLPTDIWAQTGERRLVLVTCGGPLLHYDWGNTYEDNILVYATPE